jgi:hypothetical protein
VLVLFEAYHPAQRDASCCREENMALPLSREIRSMAREYGLVVYARFAFHWLKYCVWRRMLGVLFGTRHIVHLAERDSQRLRATS